MRSAVCLVPAALFIVTAITCPADAQTRLDKPTMPSNTPTRMDTGPAPTGVTVTGSPAEAHVSWNPVPGARGYTVTRYKADDLQCCRVETALQPYLDWHDK